MENNASEYLAEIDFQHLFDKGSFNKVVKCANVKEAINVFKVTYEFLSGLSQLNSPESQFGFTFQMSIEPKPPHKITINLTKTNLNETKEDLSIRL
ncbi:MAG: hypothetical protein GF383_15845 [Candidatus Lokiarchaeota archaeon]|nr:hypothetical protein [Candidatus Lokiarchaeota archaeon]